MADICCVCDRGEVVEIHGVWRCNVCDTPEGPPTERVVVPPVPARDIPTRPSSPSGFLRMKQRLAEASQDIEDARSEVGLPPTPKRGPHSEDT